MVAHWWQHRGQRLRQNDAAHHFTPAQPDHLRRLALSPVSRLDAGAIDLGQIRGAVGPSATTAVGKALPDINTGALTANASAVSFSSPMVKLPSGGGSTRMACGIEQSRPTLCTVAQ